MARGGADAVTPQGQIGDFLRKVGELGDEVVRRLRGSA